jgi:ligand-binding sensor domain-containing protein/two-component sensor histidine kinase
VAIFFSAFGRALSTLGFVVMLHGVARAEHVPSRVYTTADGLAHNVVNRIVGDSRGYFWFCTREGLSRFDGGAFVNYGIEHGLAGADIEDFLETRDGRYWVATNRGLMRFDPMGHLSPAAPGPRMFDLLAPPGRTSPLSVTRLLEDRAGDLWVGTLAGLYRIRSAAAGMEAVPINGEMPEVLSLAERQPDELWVGTSSGLHRLPGGGHIAASVTVREGLPGNFVRALLADREGRLWVAADPSLVLLAVAQGGRVTIQRTLRASDRLTGRRVHHLLQTSNGRIWVATDVGLARVSADTSPSADSFALEPAPFGAPSGVLSLAEDRDQRLWVGSTNGAARLIPEGITIYSAADGVPAASSLIQTPRGDVAAMTAGSTREGAVWFDGRRFVTVALPPAAADVSWGWNQLMLVDREGDWWFGTRSGVTKFRGVTDPARLHQARLVRRYTPADGLAASVVIRLFEDSRGDVWMATVGEGPPSGLTRWDRAADRLHHYGSADGLPDFGRYFVSAFAEISGDVVIGFSGDGGLARFRNGRFSRVTSNDTQAAGTIRHLLAGSNDVLWAATARGGLLRIEAPASDRPSVSRITMVQGLSSNEIGAIVEDRSGRIFAATIRGIDRIDPQSLRITPQAADVLPAGDVFAAIRDRAGALWFGYSVGAVRLSAAADRPYAPPLVVIDSLTVNASSWPISALGQSHVGSFDVPPGRATLQVGYLTPGFGPADRVRYQIRLDGVDRDWSAPTDQRRVSYASIGPGRYRFSVRALTWDGVPSAATAGFEFRVLAPVWQRWWFLSSAFGLCLAGGYSLYRYRLSRIQHVAEMRARIARDLHDDIGTNLTRIVVLSEVARREQAAAPAAADGRLASIATVARESMTAMSEIVWAINPDRDRLVDLTSRMREYAEEVFASDDVELAFSVPETVKDVRLGADVRRDLYLVFKEATNNAARYSGCSRFHVDVRRTGDRLRLTLGDNGSGFDASGTDGNGLANMRRRVQGLGGRFDLASSPGGGTTIDVDVPLTRRAPRSNEQGGSKRLRL